MRGWRRSLAAAGLSLALLPAAAAAQSAGDEQYADPFANEQTPTATPAPAQPAPAPAAAATAAPAAPAAPAAHAATAAPAHAAQLPRTGWDAAVPGVCGLILLSAGGVLRARVRRDA
jgi:hypothetical protein